MPQTRTAHASGEPSECVIALAPIGRDAVLAQALLAEAGIRAISCSHLHQLPGMTSEGAGLVIIAEEALREGDLSPISRFVAGQPTLVGSPLRAAHAARRRR